MVEALHDVNMLFTCKHEMKDPWSYEKVNDMGRFIAKCVLSSYNIQHA